MVGCTGQGLPLRAECSAGGLQLLAHSDRTLFHTRTPAPLRSQDFFFCKSLPAGEERKCSSSWTMRGGLEALVQITRDKKYPTVEVCMPYNPVGGQATACVVCVRGGVLMVAVLAWASVGSIDSCE